MKKAKMMLTGIAVLAVVGGALAFKAKSAFNTSFCTGTTSSSCPNHIIGSTFNTGGTAAWFYTTFNSSCTGATCIATSTTFEGDN